ncbi:unnamed protein product [Symbiodinium sp. CCMP2592]|nr:unnamed protein product [Symbiodinium sp. CCMP2592]
MMVEEDGTGDMIASVEPSVVSEAVAAEAVTPGYLVTLSAHRAGLWVLVARAATLWILRNARHPLSAQSDKCRWWRSWLATCSPPCPHDGRQDTLHDCTQLSPVVGTFSDVVACGRCINILSVADSWASQSFTGGLKRS